MCDPQFKLLSQPQHPEPSTAEQRAAEEHQHLRDHQDPVLAVPKRPRRPDHQQLPPGDHQSHQHLHRHFPAEEHPEPLEGVPERAEPRSALEPGLPVHRRRLRASQVHLHQSEGVPGHPAKDHRQQVQLLLLADRDLQVAPIKPTLVVITLLYNRPSPLDLFQRIIISIPDYDLKQEVINILKCLYLPSIFMLHQYILYPSINRLPNAGPPQQYPTRHHLPIYLQDPGHQRSRAVLQKCTFLLFFCCC